MNAVGIICEYNPLHNGHIYHIEESRRAAGADAVVCAMSGNFVQRGEPAVYDKWDRAATALENGVDVIFEIPVFYCLGSASTYAVAGVSMLEDFGGATHLSFGSEAGELEVLRRVSDRLRSFDDELRPLIAAGAGRGFSFPRAREAAYAELFKGSDTLTEELETMRGPNNLLAIEYLKAVRTLDPVTVKRRGAAHDSCGFSEDGFRSASFIRSELAAGRDVSAFIPAAEHSCVPCLFDSRWFDAVRYSILSADAGDIEEAPHGGEGLGNRLRETARRAGSMDELILMTKSKRYTYTHVARLIIEVLLGIKRDMGIPERPPYLRLLGCSAKGRELLAEVKRSGANRVPIITNINKAPAVNDAAVYPCIGLDIHSCDVYNLLSGRDLVKFSDRTISPIIF